jgi:hypothetical protein
MYGTRAIQGVGQLGINNPSNAFALQNSGTVNANLAGLTLQVAPGAASTNSGMMEANNGGKLTLIGAFDNTGGQILSTGPSSVVDFAGSSITSGTLSASFGGAIQNTGAATLNGVTISNSTVNLADGSVTTLQGTTNNGVTFALNSTGTNTDLKINSLALHPGASLTLPNNFNNRIYLAPCRPTPAALFTWSLH